MWGKQQEPPAPSVQHGPFVCSPSLKQAQQINHISMGKKDKAAKAAEEETNGDAGEGLDYSTRVKFCSTIAKPLADEKLCKKVLKLAKKAAKRKQLKRGVKEVVKAIRKDVKGICILAGDISPIDVLTHIPVVCEDSKIPYIYVPSKEELGASALSKRPTSCMLIMPKPAKGGAADGDDAKEFAEAYAEVEKKVKAAEL